MRFDDIGLFWEDLPQERGRSSVARVMPPIPDTGWQLPTSLPNLARAKVITIDCETKDPEFTPGKKGDKGPGWARGVGHIVGLAVAADDDAKWYFPIRHEIEPDNNMDPERVLAWARQELGRSSQPKVGANLLYDVGWLAQEGVSVAGDLIDVQYAEALLEEQGKVALDELGAKYLGERKTTSLLYQWCADYYGGPADGKQRANIYRTPARLTGPYAEGDVDLPRKVIKKQYPLMQRQGLLEVFKMECGLIPLLVAMRFAGVSVDVNRADEVQDRLQQERERLQENLNKTAGMEVNLNSTASLADALEAVGIQCPRTAKGNPSTAKDFLKSVEHPLADLILECRKVEKIKTTFVESYIQNAHVKGRVYGQFHLLRSDGGGARSGRFSSSTPNLQNIPSRDEELAPIVRGLYIPDEGHVRWRKYDYSQIEYRFLAHYAVGPQSDELRTRYNEDTSADYHEIVRQMIKEIVGILLERKPTKTINFGLLYGMGLAKLAVTLGLSSKETKVLFSAYHEGAPFVRATMEQTMEEAATTGIITTIMGRRSRFDYWEPAEWSDKRPALPGYELALRKYGQVRRAMTHKALNRRLQGSAADLIKATMLRCWEDGIFNATGVPRLTVHDEVNFSDPGTREAHEGFQEMNYVMENTMKLRVPIVMDGEYGANWGFLQDMPRDWSYEQASNSIGK